MASEDGREPPAGEPTPANDGGASATRGPYTGLLVDYGGVLTTNLLDSFADFCANEGLAREAVIRSLRTDERCRELLIALETGRLPEREFEARFAAILGVSARDLIPRMLAGSRPDPVMAGAVRAARRAGIQTGLISNSWSTSLYDRPLLAELFDAVVISGEVGIRKPAPEIYRLAAERIAVLPQACVFVDDLLFNLEPAKELGMATVHHVRTDDTVEELERLLGAVLRHPVR
jgi:epoxide hydrolase-like predicted phosphatase